MDENTSNQTAFLGRGLAFPPTFNKDSRDFVMVEGVEDVQESLVILLSTWPKERILSPDFGCSLDLMLFEPLDTTLITEMEKIIEDALVLYEPRIAVNEVKIEPNQEPVGEVLINIDYTVLSTNSRFNFVYPFYKEEGTAIF